MIRVISDYFSGNSLQHVVWDMTNYDKAPRGMLLRIRYVQSGLAGSIGADNAPVSDHVRNGETQARNLAERDLIFAWTKAEQPAEILMHRAQDLDSHYFRPYRCQNSTFCCVYTCVAFPARRHRSPRYLPRVARVAQLLASVTILRTHREKAFMFSRQQGTQNTTSSEGKRVVSICMDRTQLFHDKARSQNCTSLPERKFDVLCECAPIRRQRDTRYHQASISSENIATTQCN